MTMSTGCSRIHGRVSPRPRREIALPEERPQLSAGAVRSMVAAATRNQGELCCDDEATE